MRLKDVIKMLEQIGFERIRSGKHAAYSNGTVTVFVPHNKVLNRYTAISILKKAGLRQ